MESLISFFNSASSTVVAFAGTAIGTFLVAVILDDLLGVMLAVRTGTFDPNKLPSFLESQFGTKQAAALAGAVLVAVFAGQYASIQTAALALVTAGGSAMTLSVLGDIIEKVKAIAATFQSAPAQAGGAKVKLVLAAALAAVIVAVAYFTLLGTTSATKPTPRPTPTPICGPCEWTPSPVASPSPNPKTPNKGALPPTTGVGEVR
jgi:hypothetical protein